MLELPCEQKSFVLVFETVIGNFSSLHRSSCMKGVVPSKSSGTFFLDWTFRTSSIHYPQLQAILSAFHLLFKSNRSARWTKPVERWTNNKVQVLLSLNMEVNNYWQWETVTVNSKWQHLLEGISTPRQSVRDTRKQVLANCFASSFPWFE